MTVGWQPVQPSGGGQGGVWIHHCHGTGACPHSLTQRDFLSSPPLLSSCPFLSFRRSLWPLAAVGRIESRRVESPPRVVDATPPPPPSQKGGVSAALRGCADKHVAPRRQVVLGAVAGEERTATRGGRGTRSAARRPIWNPLTVVSALLLRTPHLCLLPLSPLLPLLSPAR